MLRRVLILGCGYAGSAVARLARERGQEVLATVRSAERAGQLTEAGFAVLQAQTLDAGIAQRIAADTHVVVAFPADAPTDACVAPLLRSAGAITYISSTGVYGDHTGALDDSTPLPGTPSERAARLLAAEASYRARGATVLRCPGIYGPDRGLHMRVLRGEHRIPGDGSNTLSRIHIVDLAELVLASERMRAETFIVSDLVPAPHLQVVQFICEAYGVPMPPFVPLHEVHESLRANRQIDPARALALLGVTLRYPSYREGMAPEATGIAKKPRLS